MLYLFNWNSSLFDEKFGVFFTLFDGDGDRGGDSSRPGP